MKYGRVVNFIRSRPWAMLPEKLDQVMAFIAAKSNGAEFSEEELYEKINQKAGKDIEARIAPSLVRPADITQIGSLAIIPVLGVLSPRVNLMSELSGATSTEKLTSALKVAAGNEDISAIVLDINSPGGAVTGIPELGDLMLDIRKNKPIIAIANGLAASAAFWIGASASEFIMTPSGQVGSVGVFIAHEDVSEAMKAAGHKITFISAGKFKVDGNPFEPLSETARKHMQDNVNVIMDQFLRAVADGRGTNIGNVRKNFGQGRVVRAPQAKAAGMVDRIATFDATISRLLKSGGKIRTNARVDGSVREFEAFLRDEGGLSNTRAKQIASAGFSADSLRDEEPSNAEVVEALENINNIFKKHK